MTRRRARRPFPILFAALIMFGLFASGVGLGRLTDFQLPSFGRGYDGSTSRSRPTNMSIPSISVRADVTPVGRTRDGSIAAPDLSRTKTTGWYDRGPSPGDPGAAIIVGHVDDKKGPSVFYKLHSLQRGDAIVVTRKDHKVLTFAVDSVTQYPKNQFPVGAVFTAPPGQPVLRLITCGGAWIGGTTGYADNIIVFATLTPT